MKIFKALYPLITLFLIPLWIGFLTDFIKQKTWLLNISIGITTFMILIVLTRVIYEFIMIYELKDKFFRWRVDSFIKKTRNKIKNSITRTNKSNNIDYAIYKFNEMYSHNVYPAILDELIEKEKNQYKKITLQNYKIKLEAENENKKN